MKFFKKSEITLDIWVKEGIKLLKKHDENARSQCDKLVFGIKLAFMGKEDQIGYKETDTDGKYVTFKILGRFQCGDEIEQFFKPYCVVTQGIILINERQRNELSMVIPYNILNTMQDALENAYPSILDDWDFSNVRFR
jgi:hypothetical protein